MPATLTSVAPGSANPGDQVVLTGTGFLAGAAVWFAGDDSVSLAATAVIINSPTQITATLPDFGGDAQPLSVTVANPAPDTPSNAIQLALNAWPPVAAVLALCGLSALKRSLGMAVSETDSDDRFRELIQIASAQLLRIVTYDMQPVDIEGELYDGDASSVLYPRRAPVNAVSACTIDGLPVDVSTIKVYPEYIAFDDTYEWNPRLRAFGQIFGRGRQNIALSYNAGFTQVPRDLADACKLQVSFLQTLLSKQGLISDTNSVVNATTQYSQLPIAPAARIAANRYRKKGVIAV